jgi:hypothetical protein
MCVGVCAHRQGRRRIRVPERARVCMYVQVRVCVCVCVCARAWVDSSHPFIYQPPYRAHVSVCIRERIQDLAGA